MEEDKSAQIGSESANSVKTLLHFSDGIMEVVDLDASPSIVTHTNNCDLKTLDWGSWTLHLTKKAGNKTLEVCDYLGESLASFFGITTPKYQFEINEYHRMQKEKEEEEREKDLEMGSWAKGQISPEAVLKPPQPAVMQVRTVSGPVRY